MSQKAKHLIERLKTELSIKKDKDLSDLLGIKHNTLSTWKKRDSIDFNKVLELCEQNNLDLNYIFFEDENLNETVPEKTAPSKKAEATLTHFVSTHLINTNRNIALFYNHIIEEGAKNVGEIIVCQKISKKKIVDNMLYVIEGNNKYYLDTLVRVNEKTAGIPKYYLGQYEILIALKAVDAIWQVLEKPNDILPYIEEISH